MTLAAQTPDMHPGSLNAGATAPPRTDAASQTDMSSPLTTPTVAPVPTPHLLNLPNELLHEILSYLPSRALLRTSHTCRLLHTLSFAPTLHTPHLSFTPARPHLPARTLRARRLHLHHSLWRAIIPLQHTYAPPPACQQRPCPCHADTHASSELKYAFDSALWPGKGLVRFQVFPSWMGGCMQAVWLDDSRSVRTVAGMLEGATEGGPRRTVVVQRDGQEWEFDVLEGPERVVGSASEVYEQDMRLMLALRMTRGEALRLPGKKRSGLRREGGGAGGAGRGD